METPLCWHNSFTLSSIYDGLESLCDDSSNLLTLKLAVRENLRASKKEFNKTEDDLKSLQSVGQIIGEVLRPLDNERCNYSVLCSTSFFNCVANLTFYKH